MTDTPPEPAGSIVHHDLTVADADGVRDFYRDVVGWTSVGLSMGDYDDYVMQASDGTPVAGVCHARGNNADLPAQWLMYVQVDDLDARIASVEAAGGRIVKAPSPGGEHRYCVVEDPAGAVFALYGS